MQLTIHVSLLSEHLQIVSKAVPVRSPVAALEGILFECSGDLISLTATNLETGIRSSFNIEQGCEGKVTLPSRVVEIIRRLPEADLELSVDPDNYLTGIRSGKAQYQLYGVAPDQFPLFPEPKKEEIKYSFEIISADLKRMLRQTLFSVSHDEGKPAFTGVLFSLKGEKLSFSTSDTFRLAHTFCSVKKCGQKEGNFLVPFRSLAEVMRIFEEDSGDVKVTVSANQLILECGNTKISSRLLDEVYPNVERVIPDQYSGRAVIDVADLQKAVERSLLLAEGTNHIIRFSLGNEFITLRSGSKYGKNEEQVALHFEGEALEISLNAKFLLDMLRICEGETCEVLVSGPNKPCVIQDSLYKEYLYLVLPVKT